MFFSWYCFTKTILDKIPLGFMKGFHDVSKEVYFHATRKKDKIITQNKRPHTNCCHVIPALSEAHIEDEVIRCLPLANKCNLPLQFLANRWSPANKKPKYYQEYYRQHPHNPSTSHIWNPLGCSWKKYFQNPRKARHQNVKEN